MSWDRTICTEPFCVVTREEACRTQAEKDLASPYRRHRESLHRSGQLGIDYILDHCYPSGHCINCNGFGYTENDEPPKVPDPLSEPEHAGLPYADQIAILAKRGQSVSVHPFNTPAWVRIRECIAGRGLSPVEMDTADRIIGILALGFDPLE